MHELLAAGLLAVEGEYGVLGPTPASGKVLGGERELMLRREPPTSRARSSGGTKTKAAVADLDPEATERFERLGAWRVETVKEAGVPAYVVFHDATLHAVAAQAPTSIEALGGISGIGATKLDRYGAGLLAALDEES